MGRETWVRRLARLGFLSLLIGLVASPAASLPKSRDGLTLGLSRFSQSVQLHYYLAHLDLAPAPLRERLAALSLAAARVHEGAFGAALGPSAPPLGDRFNRDGAGLPQNEESVAVCSDRPNIVLSGTNDYRGLIDPDGNFTGWHFSTDGGNSVRNEGLLPPVDVLGAARPSGGDPVMVAGPGCGFLYGAGLAFDPVDPFAGSNGIGVYRSTPNLLTNCPGGPDPACWPVRRAVATTPPGHFLDKEWIDVGVSGEAGTVVWAVFADFDLDPNAPLGFTGASVMAVQCNEDLSVCTAPILISGGDPDVQFADVTIGPDGRTYVTWSEIQGELEMTAQTFVHKLRVAPAGSTEFGPAQIVATETLAIPFGGFLHANDFRVATYPKHEVRMVGGVPRIYVLWDACRFRPLDFVCEEPMIKLKYSDDDGASWSRTIVLSAGGDNYFPAIADDPNGNRLAVAWFTNRFDTLFHNRQDVELVSLNPRTLEVVKRQRITAPSNETEADPILGGFFIGDYIEVAANEGIAYVGYNANYRTIELLGEGRPVPQQDNYLTKREL